MSAIDGYVVNGTAFVLVGTGGGGALETLGYTESGVDKEITENKSEIITDLFGPMTPQDFQDMGMVARVICPFIAYDRTVLAKVMNRGDRTVQGTLNTPGLVLGVTGYAFSLAISSTFDAPWFFYAAILRSEGTRLATKANPDRLEFLCWPYTSFTAVTGKNTPLWKRSLS